jgi:glycosyltransferase involved in cell wall biosynthesis
MPLRIAIDVRRLKDFGIGTYIRNLVRSLGEVDHQNQYILAGRPADLHYLAGLPPNFQTAAYSRSDSERLDHVAFPLFLRGLSADLFHIPLNNVPLWMPKPYVVTIHDMSSLLFEKKPGTKNNLLLYRFRRGLLRADRVIAVSEATRHDVENLLGIPSTRIRQIYSAPDPRFSAHPPAADARAAGPEGEHLERRRILERYQIAYPFLLYAGTIRPHKNIPRLVEAYAVVRDDLKSHPYYKDLRLIIIGDEISRFPEVRRAVIQAGVEQVVRFLGFVPFDTLRVFFETAAAFVFPSLYEGFGLPPLEAMSTGTPVVASNVVSLREAVGDAAALVNPENVFDIARGIREVLLDEDLRRSLVRRGHQQLTRFDWLRTAREVADTYLEVAGRAPPH